ncbi:hypothetical protein CPB83DRAFT_840164 [Crepidotus variabilis]|uniref:Uncharacterized protein n=1 Tax=Crepidotus variabilis TaxID=179855 RepID=A0A9P6E5B9_9AGAR|nr:hypothetical protein CPB83DRAFT_840164 [Crepidotus variabilis]
MRLALNVDAEVEDRIAWTRRAGYTDTAGNTDAKWSRRLIQPRLWVGSGLEHVLDFLDPNFVNTLKYSRPSKSKGPPKKQDCKCYGLTLSWRRRRDRSVFSIYWYHAIYESRAPDADADVTFVCLIYYTLIEIPFGILDSGIGLKFGKYNSERVLWTLYPPFDRVALCSTPSILLQGQEISSELWRVKYTWRSAALIPVPTQTYLWIWKIRQIRRRSS